MLTLSSTAVQIESSTRRGKARPAVDFLHQGIDQIGAIDARKVVGHGKSARCKIIGQQTIARAKGSNCLWINRDDLSRNCSGDLVAQMDRVEAGQPPHRPAPFSAKQQAYMARHHHFDSLQRERVFDYRRALSDGAIVRQRNENWPEPMAYSHGAL